MPDGHIAARAAPGRAASIASEARRRDDRAHAVPPAPHLPFRPPPAMPFPTHLGKYEIRRELGKGSMGVVYEAFDPLIERSVAIKIIRPDQLGPSQSVELLARLKREAQAVGRLNHPGVVAIYDYGEDASFGGTKVAFIAMELIDGKELKHYFDNKHRFSPSDIARIMGEVLSALQHAHERGVTHRDVKPSNVILLRSGAVKMADFGVARLEKSELTQAGTMIGTPMYMSPEQILGMAGVDGRADIFSCGVMLYQFLTGEKPFTGSVTIVMQKVLNEEPPPPTQVNPSLSPAWDAVVRKAMAKKPADRYQSAAALADAIRGAAATKGDESTVVLPIQRPSASGATLNPPATAPAGVPAPAPAPAAPAPAAAASGPPTFAAPPASAADADGTAWTGAVPPGRNVAEDPTMFVRAKAPSERPPSSPPAAAPAALPTDPLAMPPAPAGSSAGASASTSAIFGAGFGATPGQGASTSTMRSASQAAAAAAVSAVLSSHRQPAQAATGARPADDPDATALRPGGPPAPPPRTSAAAASAPAAGSPSATSPSAAKPLLIGGGVIILLLLAAGAFWLTRSPGTPVATLPDPAASAVVAAPAPAPEPVPVPVEPPAPAPVAAASAPEVAPASAVVAAAPAEPPAASAPAAAEAPHAAEWRERTARLQAARNPLGLPAALGLLLDLPSADDRRVAADLDTLMKSRPPHSALAMAVSDGQLRFHWQSGRPSANGAADAAVRRCRELFGSKAGCAAVVVNGDFKRDAFSSVAALLGAQNAATVRNRFLRTLDRAMAEQRAKDAPAPAEPVIATPAGRDTGTATAAASRPAPARPVNEWADAMAQLRAAEGSLTLARGFELLLQVKDAGEVERLQQLQSAVKRLRWKSAMAIGDRGGLIGYGFSREERIVQWAEERAVAECTATGARGCTVVMVDGNLRPGAFIEFAGRLGGRGQAQVRETFLRDVQRSLQSGI
jgi:serine/threonine protein kinase